MMTYLAQCSGDCADFSSLDAKWVKIDEAGREGNQPAGDWIQATTVHVNKSYSMKLPDNLPAGNYLMRHEVSMHRFVRLFDLSLWLMRSL